MTHSDPPTPPPPPRPPIELGGLWGYYRHHHHTMKIEKERKILDARNYHGIWVLFRVGQRVTLVDDDGYLVLATVIGIADGLLELRDGNGDKGYELPSDCY